MNPKRQSGFGCDGLALALTAALGGFLAGCSDGAPPPSAEQPSPWASLPQVAHAERELQALGSREETLARICARNRGDGFANALCSGAQHPQISDLRGLLQLNGLGDSRAFALTGNSTSLVAKSVSAVPYPLVDVTDAAKRDAASQSYLAVVQARAPRESLLDTRNVFIEDASAKLSFVPKVAADGKTVLL